MSLENFRFFDNEPFDNSILKRDHLKIYHQHGANINDPDQNVEFIFGENNNYYQFFNAYLEFDITVRDTAGVFTNASNITLLNNALAFCFKEASLFTTGKSDLEHINYVGHVGPIMRFSTCKGGDLSSCLDKSGESALNDNNLLKRVQINNHIDYNKGK